MAASRGIRRGNWTKAFFQVVSNTKRIFFVPVLETRLHYVGPNHSAAPRSSTVLWNLVFLVAFVGFLGLAANFSVNLLRTVFAFLSGLGFVDLFSIVSVDFASYSTSCYTRDEDLMLKV